MGENIIRVKAKCPNKECGRIYEFTLRNPENDVYSHHTCPKCKNSYFVGDYIEAAKELPPMPEISKSSKPASSVSGSASESPVPPTQLPPKPSVSPVPPQPAKPKPERCASIGYLTDDKGNKWQLHLGSNVFGRKADSSTAEFQIPTADTSMSRKHACISVAERSDGTVSYKIFDTNSKNGTFVNDCKLEKDQRVLLLNGDIISFSQTKMKLHIKNSESYEDENHTTFELS